MSTKNCLLLSAQSIQQAGVVLVTLLRWWYVVQRWDWKQEQDISQEDVMMVWEPAVRVSPSITVLSPAWPTILLDVFLFWKTWWCQPSLLCWEVRAAETLPGLQWEASHTQEHSWDVIPPPSQPPPPPPLATPRCEEEVPDGADVCRGSKINIHCYPVQSGDWEWLDCCELFVTSHSKQPRADIKMSSQNWNL